MKDLTKYYLNLEKCSEDEIKSLPQILENAGEKIHDEALNYLSEGMNGNTFNCLAITDFDIWTLWNENAIICLNHTELTYPEFIKLFEGGESDGWIKIESEADLPKEKCALHVYPNYLKRDIFFFYDDELSRDELMENHTHYQPIQKPEPPKF